MKKFILSTIVFSSLFVITEAKSVKKKETQNFITEKENQGFITTHTLNPQITYHLIVNTSSDLIITSNGDKNQLTVDTCSKDVTTKIKSNSITVTQSSKLLKEPVMIDLPDNVIINISVTSFHGLLSIIDPLGQVTVNISGNVRATIENASGLIEIDGNGCSGSIKIINPKADVTATSNSGNILFDTRELNITEQRISLKTTSGNVTCYLPKNIHPNKKDISISTTSGDIDSAFNYTKPWPKWISSKNNNATLSIKTTSGDVTVSKK